MFAKLNRFLLLFMTVFALSGCQETENGQYKEKMTNIEIKEDIDFADVYVPDEVYSYWANFWEQKDEIIIDAFIEGDYDKTEDGAFGKSYLSAPDTKEEKVIFIYDGGVSWFGRNKYPDMKGGFNFSYHNNFYSEGHGERDNLELEYCNRKKMSNNKIDEKDSVFINAKETVMDKLDEIGMKGYDINASAFFSTDSKKKGILIYWKQFIDNIPLTDIFLNSSVNIANTKIYNSKIFNDKMNSLDSTLRTVFAEEKLIEWSNKQCIDGWKKLKKYPVIPVLEAYKKVKEQFRNGYSDNTAPVLEMAQLQYYMAQIDDNIYLYPVWVFIIRTEQTISFQNGTGEADETYWNYYLIDAVSGEYFTDIDTEELEK